MLELGRGADSIVYKSSYGKWVYKVYSDLSRIDVRDYHTIQNNFSKILDSSKGSKTLNLANYQLGKIHFHQVRLHILSHKNSSILSTSEIEGSDFGNRIVTKVPFIEGRTLDEIDDNQVNICFEISEKIRNELTTIIGFPPHIDINPCNIKVVGEKSTSIKFVITDIASEIQSLLKN